MHIIPSVLVFEYLFLFVPWQYIGAILSDSKIL
jgi:hypothetical protein